MGRLTAVTVCILVYMAVAAGCGSKSSSSAGTTTIPKYGNISSFRTASGPLIGGAVQKGPFAYKQLNYSSVTSPAFRNVSSAFNGPIAVTTDGTNHYVANYLSHNIVKIDPGGVVTNFAGAGFAGFGNSSTAKPRTAIFNSPADITTDGTTFYVADNGNHVIRKIDVNGRVTVLAGVALTAGSNDTDTSLGVVASFNRPSGVTIVGGLVFVVDSNNHTIRMIKADGTVTTVAGYPGVPGSADGDRTLARFNQPAHITSDGLNLYVTDFGNRTVRRISLTTGIVDTIAGLPGSKDITDGPKGVSRFNQPNGITTDGINLYITDSFERTVRRIELGSGNFTTSTIWRGLNIPIGITTNGSGLYIASRETSSIARIK